MSETTTDDARPLPKRVRVLYAAQSLPTNAISQAWGLWLIYFYVPPDSAAIDTRIPGFGALDARLVLGALLTSARLLDAIDDPLVGYWSDRTRSRWGRRIPFIAFGTPLWTLTFVLLFTPPVAEASGLNAVYLFGVAFAFYLLSNLSGAPLEALLPQLARRDGDRVSVASWQVLFGVSGAVIGLSVSSLLQEFFGFAVMAMVIATIALVVRYVALAGAWRYALEDNEPATGSFWRALRDTFSNPQFLAFLPSFVLFQLGLHLLTAVLPFYVDTILGASSVFGYTVAEHTGIFTFALTAAVIGGMLASVPFFNRWARRAGKARVYRAAMLGAAGYFPVLFLIGLVPGVPAIVQAIVAIFLAGIPTAGVFLFPAIITADIVDDDATRTETRREAMFYGAQNQLEKAATALAPLLFALILLAGDTAEDPLGIRLVGPFAGLLVLAGYLAFRRYSLERGTASLPL